MPIVERVQQAMAQVVRRKEIVERLATDGAEPDGGSPAELRSLLERDMQKMSELAGGAGRRPEKK
jgi:tripartite-type tricarboxylate transporter receptor subunit TctC